MRGRERECVYLTVLANHVESRHTRFLLGLEPLHAVQNFLEFDRFLPEQPQPEAAETRRTRNQTRNARVLVLPAKQREDDGSFVDRPIVGGFRGVLDRAQIELGVRERGRNLVADLEERAVPRGEGGAGDGRIGELETVDGFVAAAFPPETGVLVLGDYQVLVAVDDCIRYSHKASYQRPGYTRNQDIDRGGYIRANQYPRPCPHQSRPSPQPLCGTRCTGLYSSRYRPSPSCSTRPHSRAPVSRSTYPQSGRSSSGPETPPDPTAHKRASAAGPGTDVAVTREARNS